MNIEHIIHPPFAGGLGSLSDTSVQASLALIFLLLTTTTSLEAVPLLDTLVSLVIWAYCGMCDLLAREN